MADQAPTAVDPWAIWIPVVASFIAAGAAIFVALWTQRTARGAEEAARRTERAIAWLRASLDVYGSITFLRSTGERLRRSLNREGEARFRLVHRIKAIKEEGDPMRIRTVEQIIAINARVAELIEKNASMMEYPLPETFKVFLVHQRGLDDLWQTEQDATSVEVPPFPNDIDRDIEKAIDGIWRRLRALGVEPILSGTDRLKSGDEDERS